MDPNIDTDGREFDFSVFDSDEFLTWNPSKKDSYEEFARSQLFRHLGLTSSGLSVEYDKLPEIDGIKQVPADRWVDTIHCNPKELSITLQIPHADTLCRSQGTHRNFTIYNTGLYDVCLIDHLGDKLEAINAHHSTDVRVTLENAPVIGQDADDNDIFGEPAGNVVILNKPRLHVDFDAGNPERRWQEMLEWGKDNFEASKNAPNEFAITLQEINTPSKAVVYYQAYVYQLMRLAAVEENRVDDAKWDIIESGMIDWKDYLEANPDLSNASQLSHQDFHNDTQVFIWDADSRIIEDKRNTGIVLAGGDEHVIARNALGVAQHHLANNTELRGISLLDQQLNGISYTPNFSAGVFVYTATTNSSIVNVHAESRWKYANVEASAISDIQVGQTIVLEIVVTSQDKSETGLYNILITRE